MRILWGLALLFLSSCTPPIRPGFRTTHDEFTRRTNAVAEFWIWGDNVMDGGGYGRIVAERGEARVAVLNMTFDHDGGWRYLDCHQTNVLADGVPVDLGESRHRGNVRSGGVIEHVSLEISGASIRQLASANRVRIRVCGTTFHPDDEMPTWTAAVGRSMGVVQ